MIFMILHVSTAYSIGQRRLRPNPRQQNHKDMDVNYFLMALTIFSWKKSPAANLKGNNNRTNMMFIMIDNVLWGKSACGCSQTRQKRSLPDFTKTHWNLSTDFFTGIYRIALSLIFYLCLVELHKHVVCTAFVQPTSAPPWIDRRDCQALFSNSASRCSISTERVLLPPL